MANEIEKNNGEIIIYRSEDGKIKLDVALITLVSLIVLCVTWYKTKNW